jgi:hypothetical protein
MKAISLTYQRNGVAGEGFFQFLYTHKEDGMKKQLTFVATFDIKFECTPKEQINYTTCRVTSVEMPKLGWRGDRIASDIQNYLYKTYGEPKHNTDDYFWHLIEKVNSR